MGEDKGKDKELPEPVDVLVDTVIGFLEKGTAYLRAAANQVFALLSGSVQESTIDLILTVSSFRAWARPGDVYMRSSSLSASVFPHSNWSAATPKS